MPLLLVGAATAALLLDPRWWFLAALIILPWLMRAAQITLRKLRRGLSLKVALAAGVLLMIGKIPQLLGFAEYHRNRLMGRASQLIEHKGRSGA